ncbi:MAG: hypothetical protein WAO20_03705 [Acidobacteriota bacterium]
MMRLGEIAYARSGDKGSAATLAVFARRPEDFPALEKLLTADRVQQFFEPMGCGPVQRFSLPKLQALNFVLPEVLAGGGSRSLRVDAQGKAIGQIALEMELALPTGSEPDHR